MTGSEVTCRPPAGEANVPIRSQVGNCHRDPAEPSPIREHNAQQGQMDQSSRIRWAEMAVTGVRLQKQRSSAEGQ